MPTEEQIAETRRKIEVMEAYCRGEPIEMKFTNQVACCYTRITDPDWTWSKLNYRVVRTKPSINWDHVSPQYVALARDSGGDVWLYTKTPTRCSGTTFWAVDEGGIGWLVKNTFASFTPGTCDWKDSLVIRPGYEEQST